MPTIPDLTSTESSGSQKGDFDPLRVDVPGKGMPESARFAFVAEAPGTTEMKKGDPLVGQAGQLFDRILNAVGIPRFQTYLTNFCKTQLPNNDEKKLLNQKGWKHPSFGELQSRIIQELSQLRTDLIVLMGDTAMRAVLDDPKFSKITKFRGSVYRAEDFPHLAEPLAGKKILITNHPASALPHADPKNFYIIMTDLEKLLQLEDDPSVLDATYTTHINPAFPEILDFLNEVSKVTETSFDIEANPRQTTCFAFTLNPSEAMCVPLVNNSGNIWTPEQELQIWKSVAQILEGSPGLIMQNGMFDMMFKLRTLDLKTSNFIFDTMLAQHLCWADLPKGLDFITSVYTYHPYYKDEGKQEHLKAIKDWNNYWLYNARDAVITHQVKEPLERELTRFGAWDTYNFLMRLHKPLAEMEYVGIRTNQSEYYGIPAARRRLDKQIGVLYNALERFAGKKININSPNQMKEYFYVDLGLKPYTNRKTGNLSVDDEALKRISRQGRRGSSEAKIVRKIRTLNRLLSNYFNVSVDPDHRLRCQYKIAGTETGRLASAGTFFGTGTNLQNVPPAFKKYLIPDQGNLLIEIDLAQAEAVVVAYVSQDANMIAGFESDVDVHTYNASQIFDKPMEEVSKLERSMGKRVVHACVDSKTEVLTTRGWIKVSEVDPNEPIAQWSSLSKEIQFIRPKSWNSYIYEGGMFNFSGRGYDQTVTPNHKMPFETNKNLKTTTAEDLFERRAFDLPVSGKHRGEETLPESAIILITAIQADGSYSGNKVRFHLKKPAKIERLENTLQDLSLEYRKSDCKDGSVDIATEIPYYIPRYLDGKNFKWTLLNLDYDSKLQLVNESVFWDGSTQGARREYCSSNKENCDIISTLAHLTNHQGLVRKVQRAWIVSLNRRKYAAGKSLGKIKQLYEGTVYCPTTDKGFFLVRRNGAISITGNSNYAMGYKTFALNTEIPEKRAKELLEAYHARFPGLRQWHREVQDQIYRTRTLYNLFGRPKRFLGMIDQSLLRSAYAFIPQSTVAEQLNRGITSISEDPQSFEWRVSLNLTVHDSVLLQIPNIYTPSQLSEFFHWIQSHMEIPLWAKGTQFTIRCDAKLSLSNWKEMVEIKSFDPETIEAAYEKL
jgi:uracil-DNA glycosylase family 4